MDVDTIDRSYAFHHPPRSRLPPPRRPPDSNRRRNHDHDRGRVTKPASNSKSTRLSNDHHSPTVNWFRVDNTSDNPTTQLDTNLPKNFRQPLTCFFWYQYKRCSKSFSECPYAHYDTGFIAKAPFGLAQSSVPPESLSPTPAELDRMKLEVEDKTKALAQRERDVEEREVMVVEKERQFAIKMRSVEKALGVREKIVKRREEALRRGDGGGRE